MCSSSHVSSLKYPPRNTASLFSAPPLCPPPTRLYISPLTSRHAIRQSALLSLSLSLSPLVPLLSFPPLPTAAPLSISPFTVLHKHTHSLSLPYSLFLLLSRVYIHTRAHSLAASLPFALLCVSPPSRSKSPSDAVCPKVLLDFVPFFVAGF